jgi:hypothetical protein
MKIINLKTFFNKIVENFKIISLVLLFLFKLSFKILNKNYYINLKFVFVLLEKMKINILENLLSIMKNME